MKAFFRSRAVQWLLSQLLSFYIDVTQRTMRWTFLDREIADATVASPEGAIGCFWHGRLAVSIKARDFLKARPRRVLISLSRDGQFIADTVGRLGFPAIRGSTEQAAGEQRKGGAAALLESLRFLQSGGVVFITPDGPRGPDQTMAEGVVSLARVSRKAVILVGLAASPAIQMSGWDKGRLPLPFSHGCMAFDGPHHVPHNADAETREALRVEWQDRLRAAQVRAEAAVAGRAG